jgi:ankyrin repeat protein
MESVFFKAVKEGNEGEVARLLDDDPALLEKADHEGFTPFLLAAEHGQLGVMELLIRRGADTSAASMSGYTALHVVAWGGQEQAAAFLLGQGAQSTRRGNDGSTPFMLACWRGHLGVVRVLVQQLGKQELEATNKGGQTALHAAASCGNKEIVSFLLGQGALPSSRDKNGTTPLMLACEEGQTGMVNVLLQHVGPEALRETNEHGLTALHCAALWGHGETVTFLLGQGAQANSRDEDGTTPFMMACQQGHMGVVKVLLQHMGKQALQETDNEGRTALHYAAYGGHEEIAAFLISQGAQCSSRTARRGGTPFMWACRQGRLGVVYLLLQHIGPEALQERDVNGRLALHWACKTGRGEVVRALLIGGADPTVTDRKGRTPRAIAEEEGEDEEEKKGSRAGCVAAFKVRRSHVVAHTSLVWPAYIPSPERADARRCVIANVLQWYECEVERRRVLARATCFHKAYTTQRDQVTSQVPTYLEARVAAGHAVPSVEVVSPQSKEQQEGEGQAGASGKRKAAGERDEGAQGTDAGEEEGHAVLTYVLTALDEHLLTELLEGFPCEK